MNNELYHHGVKGMKWGVRKASGFVEDKPKTEPSWKHKKSDWMKKWEDDYGINPHRPNGTKPGQDTKPSKQKGSKVVAGGLAGALATATVAGVAVLATKYRSHVLNNTVLGMFGNK
jgi:hypothetical protein